MPEEAVMGVGALCFLGGVLLTVACVWLLSEKDEDEPGLCACQRRPITEDPDHYDH